MLIMRNQSASQRQRDEKAVTTSAAPGPDCPPSVLRSERGLAVSLSCDRRDGILLSPDLPQLRGVPASIGMVKCPACEQRAAVIRHEPAAAAGPDAAYTARLVCGACGADNELDPGAYAAGLEAGVLVRAAREHDTACGHQVAGAISGWQPAPRAAETARAELQL